MPESYELILRGGQVIDPARGVDRVADVAVRNGRIAAVEAALPCDGAAEEVDASGCLVLPGLIDIHTHCFWGASPFSIDPEPIAGAMGVTTWVDTGTAGAGTIDAFVRYVVERAKIRIIPLINVSFIGLAGIRPLSLISNGELNQDWLLDTETCVAALRRHRDVVRGIKLRASFDVCGANFGAALTGARFIADSVGLPLMTHISLAPPSVEDVLPFLRRGDVLTHCYTPFLSGILDGEGKVKDDVWRARERGVLFDVGHGSGSFSFDVAEAALAQGFAPDFISTDLHTVCIDGPVFDLTTTMAKFAAMGMSFSDIALRVTEAPARALGLQGEIGCLAPGACADITVLQRIDEPLVLTDVRGGTRTASHRFRVEGTYRAGERLSATSEG